MALHDSDSSLDDAGDYTETNVLLGYASKEPTEDAVSQLGGVPSWIESNAPAPASLGRCTSCNEMMTLLLQLNGELPDVFPGHERRLYVFACRRKACRRKDGSIRAFRAVRVTKALEKPEAEKEAPKEKAPQQQNIGESLFGGAQNPFSSSVLANPFSSSASVLPANPFSSAVSQAGFPPLSSLAAKPPQCPSPDPPQQPQAPATVTDSFSSKLKLDSSPAPPPLPEEPFPPSSSLPAPYPLYHLDAEYETLSAEETVALPTSLPSLEYDEDSNPASGNAKDEPYESPLDKPFQKFAARLAQNPLQALRYEFKGQPLLYSKTDPVGRLLSLASSSSSTTGMPRCGNCGAGRVFECQLTPHAIVELEVEEEGFEGMEWGTVIVGVCEKDCAPRWVKEGNVGYLEEWAGVQLEEVGKKG